MEDLIAKTAVSWMSVVFAPVSAISDTIENVRSVMDTILFEKLEYVLRNQDSDFGEWLKISEKFDEDNKAYNKMVHQLVYYVNAINEVDILYAYANLLRAYKLNLISKSDFFRMSFCLTKLLSEDAEYLKSNIGRNRIEENIYCLSLSSNNLMYNMSRGFAENEEDSGKEYYAFTQMGKMIDKYALSFGDENKYHYSVKDSPLAEQKLSYTQMKNAEWMEF